MVVLVLFEFSVFSIMVCVLVVIQVFIVIVLFFGQMVMMLICGVMVVFRLLRQGCVLVCVSCILFDVKLSDLLVNLYRFGLVILCRFKGCNIWLLKFISILRLWVVGLVVIVSVLCRLVGLLVLGVLVLSMVLVNMIGWLFVQVRFSYRVVFLSVLVL